MEINCSTDDNNQMELPSVMALCRQINHLVLTRLLKQIVISIHRESLTKERSM